MAVTEIRIPQTDVNDETVQLSRWLVADGGRVEPGTVILAFEASKAAVDLEAQAAGFLRHAAAKGDVVPVGAVVAWLAAAVEELPPPGSRAATAAAGRPTPAAPVGAAAGAGVGASVGVGAGAGSEPRASRKAQELAAAHGIELASLGVSGIITERHVQQAIEARAAASPPTTASTPVPLATGAASLAAVARPSAAGGSGRTGATGAAGATGARAGIAAEEPAAPSHATPVSRVQAAVARQVLHATQSRAHAFVVMRCEVDATLRGLDRILEQQKRFLAFPDVLVYHVARCLRQIPRFNAVLIGDTIHEYEQVNVAFTVDIGGRLYTPVIHDADRLSLLEICTAMQGRKLEIMRGAPPEASLRGGTFTVSVLDTPGLLYQLPIINRAQSAILGVGARMRELVPDESGTPRVATFAGLCLSYDHRLLNGAEAARFLAAVADRLGRDPEAEGGPSA